MHLVPDAPMSPEQGGCAYLVERGAQDENMGTKGITSRWFITPQLPLKLRPGDDRRGTAQKDFQDRETHLGQIH